ncbi:hypothetical protein ACGFRB_13610 [Streptomyces sp. NPDC048718]
MSVSVPGGTGSAPADGLEDAAARAAVAAFPEATSEAPDDGGL